MIINRNSELTKKYEEVD